MSISERRDAGFLASSPRKNAFRRLFWVAVIVILMISARRILATPTVSEDRGLGPVVINEMLAANSGAQLLDEDGEPSDWIELVNRSSGDVNLAGWTLTDDPTRPEKWTFPPLNLTPDEHLIVFASGKDRRFPDTEDGRHAPGFQHTNFRLDSDAGFLALYPPTMRRYLDGTEIAYRSQEIDVSYGHSAQADGDDDALVYFLEPTPGKPNSPNNDWLGRLPPVNVSVPHGLYSEPIRVALTTDLPEAEIRYTLDGSEPDETNGAIYDQPLNLTESTVLRAVAVKPRYLPGAISTSSYLFVDDVRTQSTQPAGFPETWGTHRIDFAGHAAGDPVVADYAMDPTVVDDPAYGPQLETALAALPVMSLVFDPSDFELYADPQARGPASERPASAEFFDPAGQESGFQVDAGIRIQGGAGRWEFMPKHSFRLFFREAYGPSLLHYPLYPDSAVDEFDTLVLRAGTDRGFAGHPAAPGEEVDHRQTTYARDEWTRASQIDMSGTGVHGRFTHLYVNGLYWGIYNLVERPDAAFMAGHFGGDDDEYASVNQAGSVSGLVDRTATLLRLAQEGNLADNNAYATMLEFVDPIQFSDYIILNWYAGNRDWPVNNWYAGVRYPAGQNHFFVWDAEATLDGDPHVFLDSDSVVDAPFGNIIKQVFEALMENPDFRLLFADRLYLHTQSGGALSDEEARARWLAETEPLETAIIAESARWGDARYEDPITQAEWLAARASVEELLVGRGHELRALAAEAGYYPPIDPPRFSTDDPFIDERLDLQLTTDGGEIYYTLDGSDPRAAGSGLPAASAVRYDGPFAVNRPTQVKARVLIDGVWSALDERFYRRADDGADVRITELMYNPTDGEAYEFFEVTNLGTLPADLSGAYVTGVDYRFPEHTWIDPGEVKVIVADFRRFRERYAEAEIAGIFEGKLSDRGETIGLYARDGEMIDSVSYEDGDGWPLSADGTGDSLELAEPERDANQPHHWRASEVLHGSPGIYSYGSSGADPE